MEVFRGGRNWSLTDVAAGEEQTTRQMAAVGLEDADVDVLDARVRAVALDERKELHKKALVARERRLASSFIAQLLQICPCEVAYGAIWAEIPGIDVGGRNQAVSGLGTSRSACNPHSARCLPRVQALCQAPLLSRRRTICAIEVRPVAE
jgi:hypothetical protein